MKHYLKLFAIGFIPLTLTLAYQYLVPINIFVYLFQIFQIAGTLLWCYMVYRFSDAKRNPVLQSMVLCLLAFIMTILITYQCFVIKMHWANFLGICSQLATIPFGFWGGFILRPIYKNVVYFDGLWNVGVSHIVQACIMFVLTLICCIVKWKKVKKAEKEEIVQ